jgi:hypothetical protein
VPRRRFLAAVPPLIVAPPRRDLVEQYSHEAVELLRLARSRGYADTAFMQTDPGLDVLRAR